MDERTKKVTTMAMLVALSYLIVAVVRIPVVMFLKYEPKDVIITVGGFMLGPVEGFIISLVVSLLEMATISETGPIGAIMNMVSTCAFMLPAAIVYRKNRTLKGAVTGLGIGVITMVAVMLLWNYLLTPIYMGYPREAVAAMLVPVFLPFNLLKGVLNAAITMLIYKPVVMGLRKARLIPEVHPHGNTGKAVAKASGSAAAGETEVSDGTGAAEREGSNGAGADGSNEKDHRKVSGLVILISAIVMATVILLMLVLAGKI